MVKRILFSVMTIALVGLFVAGGVFAYFSDVESSDANFTAGTLDLWVNDSNSWTTTAVTASDLAPGDSDALTMTLANIGNINGTLTVDLTNISDAPGSTPEPEGDLGTDAGELSANMDIVLWVDANDDGVQDEGEAELYTGKLDAWADPVSAGPLAAGDTTYISLSYSIDSEVGNVIQGDISTFDIEFTLDQVTG